MFVLLFLQCVATNLIKKNRNLRKGPQSQGKVFWYFLSLPFIFILFLVSRNWTLSEENFLFWEYYYFTFITWKRPERCSFLSFPLLKDGYGFIWEGLDGRDLKTFILSDLLRVSSLIMRNSRIKDCGRSNVFYKNQPFDKKTYIKCAVSLIIKLYRFR